MLNRDPLYLALNLMTRAADTALLIFMLHYLMRFFRLNGKTVGRIVEIWAAFTFLFVWMWIAWLEEATDFLPTMQLKPELMDPLSWIPQGVILVTLVRLWLVLHPEIQQKERDRKP
jgi:hypothetical protein